MLRYRALSYFWMGILQFDCALFYNKPFLADFRPQKMHSSLSARLCLQQIGTLRCLCEKIKFYVEQKIFHLTSMKGHQKGIANQLALSFQRSEIDSLLLCDEQTTQIRISIVVQHSNITAKFDEIPLLKYFPSPVSKTSYVNQVAKTVSRLLSQSILFLYHHSW